MATYEKLKYDIPPYQEGNQSDFVIELDDNFPLDEVSDITFQVKKTSGSTIMSKTKNEGSIALSGRIVTILINAEDTIGNVGTHVYEVDFKNMNHVPFITLGGTLTINKQINTL